MFELPPLHPIFLHFPVALLPVTAFFDLLGRMTKRPTLLHAAFFSLLAAAVMAPLAALSGWLWLNEMGEMAYLEMRIHQWLGTAIPVLLIPLAVWRYRIHMQEKVPPSLFLSLLLLMLAVVTLQGHLGGRMTFGGGTHADPADEAEGQHHGPSSAPAAATEPTHFQAPTSEPTSAPTENDGWQDSIHVKGTLP